MRFFLFLPIFSDFLWLNAIKINIQNLIFPFQNYRILNENQSYNYVRDLLSKFYTFLPFFDVWIIYFSPIHTVENPYSCDKCEETYSGNGNFPPKPLFI